MQCKQFHFFCSDFRNFYQKIQIYVLSRFFSCRLRIRHLHTSVSQLTIFHSILFCLCRISHTNDYVVTSSVDGSYCVWKIPQVINAVYNLHCTHINYAQSRGMGHPYNLNFPSLPSLHILGSSHLQHGLV